MNMKYELHFRASYHGMRVLIEACEKAESDGIEFVAAMPLHGERPMLEVIPNPPPVITHERSHRSVMRDGSRQPNLNGKNGKQIMRELIARKDVLDDITMPEARQHFIAYGFRGSSASSLLTWARRENLIERVASGTYKRLPGRPV